MPRPERNFPYPIVTPRFAAPCRSNEWQRLSRTDREKLGLVVRDVGEFWYNFSRCSRVLSARPTSEWLFLPLRMDFQDFCHYFTDVVVCRLVDRFLLRPSSHWREEYLYGEWAPAPPPHAPSPGNGTEARCEGRGGSQHGTTKEEGGWEAEVDKRSRCGGCINHRDTFLHNPQVELQKLLLHEGESFVFDPSALIVSSSCLRWEPESRRC